jgi:hypothetical protein
MEHKETKMAETKEFTRTFNAARREQGFKSQAHLDAFYAAYDHEKACAACQRPGTPYETTDGGLMATSARCEEGKRLDAASFGF